MHVGWPQGIYLGLTFFGFGASLVKGGREFATTTVAVVVQLGLLYWGGFFG